VIEPCLKEGKTHSFLVPYRHVAVSGWVGGWVSGARPTGYDFCYRHVGLDEGEGDDIVGMIHGM